MAENSREESPVKRRTYLISKGFQLRYAALIALVGAILAAGLGSFIHRATGENSRLLEEVLRLGQDRTDLVLLTEEIPQHQKLEIQRKDEEVERQIRAALAQNDRLIHYLIIFTLAITATLFIWGVLITHRVAGPVMVLSRYLESITLGQIPRMRDLRQGDELKDLHNQVAGLVHSLKERERSRLTLELAVLDQALQALGASDTDQAAEALRRLREQRARELSDLVIE